MNIGRKGPDVILEGRKTRLGRSLGIKEKSQISKRYMPEIALVSRVAIPW